MHQLIFEKSRDAQRSTRTAEGLGHRREAERSARHERLQLRHAADAGTAAAAAKDRSSAARSDAPQKSRSRNFPPADLVNSVFPDFPRRTKDTPGRRSLPPATAPRPDGAPARRRSARTSERSAPPDEAIAVASLQPIKSPFRGQKSREGETLPKIAPTVAIEIQSQ